MPEVKVISLYAPWAVAIALGEKKIETRSWRTDYRGEIYMHATQTTPARYYRDINSNPILMDIIRQKGEILYPKDLCAQELDLMLPHGLIIAKCKLVDCVKVDYSGLSGVILSNNTTVSEKERTLGDYASGRYAWILDDVVMLDKPIPAKGKQRIWTFDMEGVS